MKLRNLFAAAAACSLLAACQTPEPYIAKTYEGSSQNVRILKKTEAADVAVAQVRVVKEMDLLCAGNYLPIPGAGSSEDDNESFARYWKRAFETDLHNAGMLNEKDPKVKIYVLFETVKILAEPTRLRWMMDMRMFSSNGAILENEITYNAPTDSLKNIREGCGRLSASLDKAVQWSILKTISSPAFQKLLEPGLGYVPVMKGKSIQETLTSIIKDDEKEEIWKQTPAQKK